MDNKESNRHLVQNLSQNLPLKNDNFDRVTSKYK